MTGQEWLICNDPEPMVENLIGKATDRKVRLFAAACCRRIWPRILGEKARFAIEISEQFADGQVGIPELSAARDNLNQAGDLYTDRALGHMILSLAQGTIGPATRFGLAMNSPVGIRTARGIAFCSAHLVCYSKHGKLEPGPEWEQVRTAEFSASASLLRDIFGNPFHPVTFNPAWRTDSVLAVAQAIYDERRFADMPILADALEEAGCTSAEILDHCRQPAEHVRGCWVVDLVLGKD